VVWWAQRNLRATEEICCDALVLSCLNPQPQSYANSLLAAVEFLADPTIRPPAMASEINSGGFLERRFKMIVSQTSNRPNSRGLQLLVLLCAMLVLPFGVAFAQDFDAVERKLGEAVAEGDLSLEHAMAMMESLREVAEYDEDEGSESVRSYWSVEAGKLTDEQAKQHWDAKQHDKHIHEVPSDIPILEHLFSNRDESDIPVLERLFSNRDEDEGSESVRFYLSTVEAGKLTEKQVKQHYEGLKENAAGHEKSWIWKADLRHAHAEASWKKLQAMVKAGKMTEKQAHAKMAAIIKNATGAREKESRRKAEDKRPTPDRVHEYRMRLRKELGTAVERAIEERKAAGRGEEHRNQEYKKHR
jgi:polyhydroxyalkanoate synthesis regulator phasin